MPGHIQTVLDQRRAGLRRWPATHVDTRSVLFLGRHAGYPVALEGALKLKELAYIHAEGFAAGELKHGPIALIEEGLPVLCVVPPRGRDQLHDKMVSGIQEVRARGARTICLAEEGDETIDAVRRRADPAARRCRCCCSRWSRSCRCSCSPASWRRCWATTSTSRATSPSPSRSSEPVAVIVGVGIDVCDIDRFAASLERTPGLAERLFTPAERDPPAGVAGRPVRRQGGARQGARRPGGHGLARRRGGLGGVRPPAVRAPRHRSRARADALGVASVHLSLSHDAGIASAVVVLES